MSDNCGQLSYSTLCSEEALLFRASNENPEQQAYIDLDIPAGSEILDAEGNIIYVVPEEGFGKTKIRVPKAEPIKIPGV